MNNKAIYYSFWRLVCVLIGCACTPKNNRIYFTINEPCDKLVFPVRLNDSVTANLMFDTGGNFVLDSAFFTNNVDVADYAPAIIIPNGGGSAWSHHHDNTYLYTKIPKTKIGDIPLEYEELQVFNYKRYFNSETDGIFNIPQNDTIHTWELNFEHNYLEIHSSSDFTLPESCFILPMTRTNKEIYIQLPLHMDYLCDTITTNNMYVIDTGMLWDVVLMCQADTDHIFFQNKEKDAVWIRDGNGYYKYNTVNAVMFNTFTIDSLRIYTFDNNRNIGCGRLIGLNFLKHFNVFFDLKNRKLGLLPIKNFQRVVNPTRRRFHYISPASKDGKHIITKIANNKENFFYTAGLREGDEITAINGMLSKDLIREQIFESDTLLYDVVRNGQPIQIMVLVDKSIEQGD